MRTIKPTPQVLLRRIERSDALPPPHFRYSPAVQVGSDVYVSGLVGLDPATGGLAAETAAGQTRQIFRNIQALCAEQGWSLERVVVARVYCAGEGAADGMNEVWSEFFTQLAPPARTFTVVKSLPLGAAVEIEFQLSI
ncbi:endoribonuclease L-PSP family protein [Paraburkholderia xenovorans LB400]|jgi:2-iminobutanoate/2-iminopropanoate deaminase|uniref:Ferredoxin-like protein n=3 Tax=Pseudomonadota TaxID=1224 RepID=Q706S6_PSEPU|nr:MULTISPECIES: RidA family protein [Pseudomonadota]MBO9332218.1 RidA family protein [Achromobacter xylosoxidans]ABE31804.1 Putative endoribonuclease, translationalinhibitor protein [Paraburkholderia xenovorans LB400]AIP32153.1 endoribonuclease L-PSP family protein [Paraburkholderia xenovorans LB400]MDD2012808.1 RidA family protein [Pseudomonas putida]CAB3939980.1 Putative aminoacrylate peracid reductase RutC [Achromobacter insolitus]